MYLRINGKSLNKMDFEELKRNFATFILQAFVESGGRGLTTELNRIMSITIKWYQETQEVKK